MAGVHNPVENRSSIATNQLTRGTFLENTLYYLHPSENPAIVLVTPPLNATNYLSWSRSMKRALRSKRKWPIVDGSINPPDVNDTAYDDWEGCNSMVLSWLVGSMEPAIARSVSCLDTAAQVWADLRGRFGRGDSMKIARLQMALFSLKQGALSVTDYFTSFRTLWDDFCEFRPIPLCLCLDKEKGSADCESVRTSRLYQENDQVIRFLIGLNENYMTVTSHIMLMEPLPDVNRALFLALQHEQQILNSASVNMFTRFGRNDSLHPSGDTITANTVNAGGKRVWNGSKKGATCTYCGKDGHTVEKCYIKHGFPPNFKFTNSPTRYPGNGSRFGDNPNGIRGFSHSTNPVSTVALEEMNAGLAKLALTREQFSGLIALVQHSSGQHQDTPTSNTPLAAPHQVNSIGVNPISGPHGFESDW